MKYLFNIYSKMCEQGIPKEDARFILPYCFYSQISMSLNTRSLINLIEYCLISNMSQIREVKEFGLKMLEIAKEKVPYYKKKYLEFDKIIKENISFKDSLSFLDKYNTEKYVVLNRPSLISVQTDYDEYPLSKIDRTIIVSYIMNRYQLDFEKADNFYERLNEDEKAKIMDIICMAKQSRELEQVSFKFQLPTSLAGLTHLTRHRMHSLLIPDFLPMYNLNNYIIPDTIKDNCMDLYMDAVSENMKIYEELKQKGVEEKDLLYFNLSGTMINISTNINGRELLLMSRLRCCNRAQWEVRYLLNNMVEQIQSESFLYGNYLGAPCAIKGKCPEGKHSCG
ncbi:MAG: FAD-dependent thymidylate synthase, partial [Bacilli bacterium]|nr:FAD-dependent thymidylate synthase [Bacilli bacterium]